MGQLRNLAGDTVVYGLSTVAGRFLNFLLVPFYTRVFAQGEYGMVAELYAYITFFLVLYTYGMETAFFRYASRSGDHRQVFSTGMVSLFITSLLLTGMITAGTPVLSGWLSYGDYPSFIMMIGWILFFDALAVIPFALLRYQGRSLRFSLVKLYNVVLNIGFNVFFLVLCPYLLNHYPDSAVTGWIERIYDPSFGVGYVFLSNLLASVITLGLLWPELRTFRADWNFGLWKEMMVFSLPLVLVGLAGMVNEVSDRLMMRHLLPYPEEVRLEQLGIYGACYKLSIFMTLGIQAFRYAAEPFFFRKSSDTDARSVYARIMFYFVAAGGALFLSISLFLDIIKHVIHESYHEGIIVVPILLMANLFLGIYYNTSVWYKLTGKTMRGGSIALLGAVITISLNLIFIPVFGYVGAAVTTLICYFVMALVSWRWGRLHYKIDYDVRSLAFMLFSATGLYLGNIGLESLLYIESVYYQIPVRVVFIAAYILIVGRLMPPGERGLIRRISGFYSASAGK